MIPPVQVFDDVLTNPDAYRRQALALPYADIVLGPDTFRGIAVAPDPTLERLVARFRPGTTPWLSFFRKSPEGQVEPNDIHSDADMGDWTGILYLNPVPDEMDGTWFWKHRATGAHAGTAWQADGHDRRKWLCWQRIHARFNRLVLFSGPLYHSRALVRNYGQGDGARLIQVVFARGAGAV